MTRLHSDRRHAGDPAPRTGHGDQVQDEHRRAGHVDAGEPGTGREQLLGYVRHDGAPDDGTPDDGHLDTLIPDGRDPEDALAPFLTRRDMRSLAARRSRRRRRTVVMTITVLVFVGIVLLAFSFVRPILGLGEVKDYPGPGAGTVTITITEGEATSAIGRELVEKDIIANTDPFDEALAAHAGAAIQPGNYQLKHQMKAADALAGLLDRSGTAVHYAAVEQNLRQDEVLDLLAQSTGQPRSEYAQLAKDPQQFGLPQQAPSLEGYLAPGEYRFPVKATAAEVIQTMVDKTFANLKKTGVQGPIHQYHILTIASIIEAEGSKADYGKVSGAIYNRLNAANKETGGRLESDATVSYGLKRKSYEITNAEKRDKSNPYNTFAHTGLPIGPIGSPGPAAITAAQHPADVPYYYWVTVNLDTGETKYATTYAEHLKNVKEYRRWCAAHEGKCK